MCQCHNQDSEYDYSTGKKFHPGTTRCSCYESERALQNQEYVRKLEIIVAAADNYIYSATDRRQDTYTEYRRVRAMVNQPRGLPHNDGPERITVDREAMDAEVEAEYGYNPFRGADVPHNEPEYVLVGYFRFVISAKPGVMGEVISQHSSGWAYDSDVPVYRRKNETKGQS